MTLEIGQVIVERYRIEEILGQGGFGCVYKAWDIRLDIHRAIKESLDPSSQASEQFTREARVLARIKHPNLPQVFDHLDIPGIGQYLVMEFIDGDDLQERLEQAKGPLPIDQTAIWMDQILDALGYLHNCTPPIIHRDINPRNIIITLDNTAVLVDFGIAKIFDPATEETTLRRVFSPGYAPVEQYSRGMTNTLTDLYSLGATFYHCLTGERPAESVERASEDRLRRPSEVNSLVSLPLEKVILKAMQIKSKDRYHSAEKMREALQSSLRRSRQQKTAQDAGISPIEPLENKEVINLQPSRAVRSVEDTLAYTPKREETLIHITAPHAVQEKTFIHTEIPDVSDVGPRLKSEKPKDVTPEETLNINAAKLERKVMAANEIQAASQFKLSSASQETRLLKIIPENVSQMKQLVRWGHLVWKYLAWSPNGKYIAVASGDHISLYDPVTLYRKGFIQSSSINTLSFSPNGLMLASGSNDNTISIWNIPDCTLIRKLIGHTNSVNSVSFSNDGQLLISGSSDKNIILWSVKDGVVWDKLVGHSHGVKSVAVSPDGKMLASGSDDKNINIWCITDGTIIHRLEGHTDSVVSVAYSPDGQFIASGSSDKTVILWNANDGTIQLILQGHSQGVKSVTFSLDGKILASASFDQTIRLWRVSDGNILHILKGHTEVINSVAFSPDSQIIASGSDDMSLRLWYVIDGTLKKVINDFTIINRALVFSPDKQILIQVDNDDRNIKLMSVTDGVILHELEGHTAPITSLAISPDEQLLASGSADKSICLWRIPEGTLRNKFYGHNSSIVDLTFLPGGTKLASTTFDHIVRVWSIPDGILEKAFAAPDFLGKYDKFITISEDFIMYLLGVHGDNPLHKLYRQKHNFHNHYIFSPGGNILATVDGENILLWDVGKGSFIRKLEGHNKWINIMSFSPNGQILACSYDTLIFLWDTNTGTIVGKLEGHTSTISKLGFSSDGQIIVSGSRDETSCLWNVTDGRLLRKFTGNTGSSLSFTTEGTLLVTSSIDGTIQIWGIPEQ